ncbi:uncharacterized protein LOC133300102 [Gastrolobium bilobum]|uniref:uncharacterized protein LOC133300102 n=1 Tax=Gastrolobium bilobum TaxID=150636 RepID=UPI002AB1588E|nr:uncharacterized protein LOC133300102 [Gastrolobium bilobum]
MAEQENREGRGRGRGRRGRGGRRGQPTDGDYYTDARDAEIEEKDRRIQELEQQLAEAQLHESDEGWESERSSHEEERRFWNRNQERRGRSQPGNQSFFANIEVMIEIPEFEGTTHPDEFIDESHTVEKVFDIIDLTEDQKVPIYDEYDDSQDDENPVMDALIYEKFPIYDKYDWEQDDENPEVKEISCSDSDGKSVIRNSNIFDKDEVLPKDIMQNDPSSKTSLVCKQYYEFGDNEHNNLMLHRDKDLAFVFKTIDGLLLSVTFCIAFKRLQQRIDYRIRLKASLDCARYLLRNGQPFRGIDESESSNQQGLFIETLNFYTKPNKEMSHVVLQNAPDNHKLTSPKIQKDLAQACADLTVKAIIRDLGDDYFSLLVDEARDVAIKEQMAVVLRYVNKKGSIVECFIGIIHVSDTTAQSLKAAIDGLFSKLGLSLSKCRGQGYDGASNMRGEFKGLKSLILADNKSAFYFHCFAHQLQLALVKIVERIARGEILTGKGLNQETTLKRHGDTCWGSHFGTVTSVISLFSPIISLMKIIEDEPKNDAARTDAGCILYAMEDFEFAFLLHLMQLILGISYELSQALQRKDQDLLNAIGLVKVVKIRLQEVRDHGFDELLQETNIFANKYDIDIPNMEDVYCPKGRSRRRLESFTFLHYFKVELFNRVIDTQVQELGDRFDNVNTKLLECLSCLDPRDSFAAFNKEKLIEFARFYPLEFDEVADIPFLFSSLGNFIVDVRADSDFVNLKRISELTLKMVEKRKDIVYPLVYLLIKLALLLPIATASVERVFSAMTFVKDKLRNRISDDWFNACMLTYVERDIFDKIDDEDIMQYFQAMKNRRMLL